MRSRAAVIAFASSIACSSTATPGANVAASLVVDGQQRSFLLHLPRNYDRDRAYPLVFAWHGMLGSGAVAASYYRVEEAAGDAAILVYPDGLVIPGVGTGWDLTASGYDLRHDEPGTFIPGHDWPSFAGAAIWAFFAGF